MIKEYKELTDKNLMKELYIDKQLSCSSIADIIGCSAASVRNNLIKLNIKLRTQNRKNRTNKSYKDKSYMIGRKTDMLEVVGVHNNLLICKCECGNTVNLPKRRISYDKQKSCGCLVTEKGPKSRRWTGGDYVPHRYFSKIKNEAKRRNLTFNITIDYIESVFKSQNFKCKLSGVELSFSDRTASIDRINSSLGYEVGNIQILHSKVNEMKWDYEQSDFIDWCKLVARHN